MSQDKTLDNTEISNKDVKELETNKDNKLDNTTTKPKSTSRSKSSRSKSKQPKDSISYDASDQSVADQATIPEDPTNPSASNLANIKNKLTDPKIQQDFVDNIADLLSEYTRAKLTDNEKNTLKRAVETNLLQKVFKIQKLN